jgi:hypothetical protein
MGKVSGLPSVFNETVQKKTLTNTKYMNTERHLFFLLLRLVSSGAPRAAVI